MVVYVRVCVYVYMCVNVLRLTRLSLLDYLYLSLLVIQSSLVFVFLIGQQTD